MEDLRALDDSLWRPVHDSRWWAGDGGGVWLGPVPQKQAALGLCWGAENVQGGIRVVMPLKGRYIVGPLLGRMGYKTKGPGQILSMGCKQRSDLVSGQPGPQPIGAQGGCGCSAASSWSLELGSTREEGCKFPGPVRACPLCRLAPTCLATGNPYADFCSSVSGCLSALCTVYIPG